MLNWNWKDFRRDLILVCILGAFSGWVYAQLRPHATEYTAMFGDHSRVYDGDTIQDVHIVIKTLDTGYPAETLFPGILLKGDTLYAITDIRISGIDTPEKRPKKAGRSPESIDKEKAAAKSARDALYLLLKAHDFHFVVAQPEQGKYAGRIVADILVGPERINVSEYMIKNGYAKAYDGGTKPIWHW